jgi:tRNA threonylcarbamoyladenosine biosynthesis protein TsaE
MTVQFFLCDDNATVAAGKLLGGALKAGDVVYLQGDLGAGKTTFSRGVLTARGHHGACKSPTYTLVEPYHLASGPVFHFDLYRIRGAEELDYLALDDYFRNDAVCLVEWPDKGQPLLPAPTLMVSFLREADGRRVMFTPGQSSRGAELLDFLSKSTL